MARRMSLQVALAQAVAEAKCEFHELCRLYRLADRDVRFMNTVLDRCYLKAEALASVLAGQSIRDTTPQEEDEAL